MSHDKLHASDHKSAGGDAIKLDELAAPTDITTLNADTNKHGLLPKLGGGSTNFLRADGTWAAPVATAKRAYCLQFNYIGILSSADRVDGGRTIPFACTIQKITVFREGAGSSGSTIVDINKAASGGSPSTLYTTQANRPTIASTDGDNKAIIATNPDIVSLAQGDFLTVDVDQVEGGPASNLSVCVFLIEA